MKRDEFIKKICSFLGQNIRDEEGNEIPYAVCAPTVNSDGSENGARLYCCGGANFAEIHKNRIRHLNNAYVFKDGRVGAKKASQYIEESEFDDFVKKRIKYNGMSFDELDSDKEYGDFLRKCVRIAEKWSETQNKEERSIETGILQKSREKGTSCVVDMEFYIPYTWGCRIKGINVTRSPRTDLVVYDERDQSFGLIELKNKGVTDMNTQNMRKHYADFTAVLESDQLGTILKNLRRRTEWLNENGFIRLSQELPAEVNKIWYGFLFVGDNVELYRDLYTRDLLDDQHVNRWKLTEKKRSGDAKYAKSDLTNRYKDMIKNERARYQFCRPDELDGIRLNFGDMISFDEFYGDIHGL